MTAQESIFLAVALMLLIIALDKSGIFKRIDRGVNADSFETKAANSILNIAAAGAARAEAEACKKDIADLRSDVDKIKLVLNFKEFKK